MQKKTKQPCGNCIDGVFLRAGYCEFSGCSECGTLRKGVDEADLEAARKSGRSIACGASAIRYVKARLDQPNVSKKLLAALNHCVRVLEGMGCRQSYTPSGSPIAISCAGRSAPVGEWRCDSCAALSDLDRARDYPKVTNLRRR